MTNIQQELGVDSGQMAIVPVEATQECEVLLSGICGTGQVVHVGLEPLPVYAKIKELPGWGHRVWVLHAGTPAGGLEELTKLGEVHSKTGFVVVADPCYIHRDNDDTPPFYIDFWGEGQKAAHEELVAAGFDVETRSNGGGRIQLGDRPDQAEAIKQICNSVDGIVVTWVKGQSPYNACCDVTMNESHGGEYAVEHGTAVACRSGCGDGAYPLHVSRSDGFCMTVTFITDRDLEDDDS